jgi:hypothetical protein
MIKKILFAFLGCISMQLQAQLLKPLAQGVSDDIVASTTEGGELFVTTRHSNGTGKGVIFTVNRWNDIYWIQPYASFIANDSAQVRCMSFYKGSLYLGGSFTTSSPTAKNLIRYNIVSNKWEGLASSVINFPTSKPFINAMTVYKGQLYIAGEFYARTGSDSVTNIARYNGSTFSRCASNNEYGTNGSINDLFVLRDTLYAGGSFSKAGTLSSPGLIGWDSVNWIGQSFTSAVIGKFCAYQNRLTFTVSDSQQVFNKVIIKNIGGGYSLIPGGILISQISDLEDFGSELWLSGNFSVNGQGTTLVKFTGSNWVNSFLPAVQYTGLTKFRTSLTVFTTADIAGGIRVNHIAQIVFSKARISGHVYADMNTNCRYDGTDKPFGRRTISISGNDNYTTVTDSFGFYSILVNPGTYDVSFHEFKNWKVDSPCSKSKYTISLSFGSKDSVDFSMKPAAIGQDIGVTITPDRGYTAQRGGTEAYSITYTNNGTQDISNAAIKLVFNKKLTGFASPQQPVINGNEAVWPVSNLKIGESRNLLFSAKARTDSFNVNDKLEFIASSNLLNDLDRGDNMDTIEQELSSDPAKPILKDVYPEPSPGDTVSLVILADDDISYVIHFENTSLTDTIRNLVVIDTVDLNSNILFFEETGASHPYTTKLYSCPSPMNKGVFVFTFSNINLPPFSNSDDVNNRGHIGFKMKMKTSTPVGTLIVNTAYVVMDYIDMVQTNTTYARITDFKGINKVSKKNTALITANPVHDGIKLRNQYQQGTRYSIISASGQEVLSGDLNGNLIDIRLLASGVYFLILQTETEIQSQKILIN